MAEEEILEEREGLTLRIEQDDSPMSPDEWGDDGVFLVGFHRQFWVVREGFKDPTDVEAWRETHEILALHAYIHSGVALSLSNTGYPFNDRWDACQVGYVLVKKDEATEKVPAEQIAEGLVDTWNQYLSGDVWGVTVEDEEGEHLDSCWGFYGRDYAQSEGQEMLEAQIEHVKQLRYVGLEA